MYVISIRKSRSFFCGLDSIHSPEFKICGCALRVFSRLHILSTAVGSYFFSYAFVFVVVVVVSRRAHTPGYVK